MKIARNFTLLIGAVLLFGLASAVFTVNQTQQALVLQFGEPKRTIQEPGLAFKLPFIQDVRYYEKRVLSLIPQDAEEVILADQKRVVIDAYARYRIMDPLLFFQTVRNEQGATARLESIIDSSVRRVLGGETLASILTGEREDINSSIRDEVESSVNALGIEIIDVRLREFRATGEEEAQKIRADAEKTRTVILAEAAKTAQELRGNGDGQAINIYAESFGRDKEFFSFYRSMEAYTKSLGDAPTSMVLSPNSSFFRYFKDQNGGGNS